MWPHKFLPARLPWLHCLLEFAQTHVHWVSVASRLSHPLLPPSPLTLSLSQHQGFSSELALCIKWPKYWSFSYSIILSDQYSGLISFRIDWFDLLAVQGTLKNLLQHHVLKTLILWHWHLGFFMVRLSCLHVTVGKTIALTVWTFVGKVMSLLCNKLSGIVIAFLPRSKCLLISLVRSLSAVILEPKKKPVTVCIFSLSVCREVMGLDAMISVFWMLSFKPAFFTPLFYPHQVGL